MKAASHYKCTTGTQITKTANGRDCDFPRDLPLAVATKQDTRKQHGNQMAKKSVARPKGIQGDTSKTVPFASTSTPAASSAPRMKSKSLGSAGRNGDLMRELFLAIAPLLKTAAPSLELPQKGIQAEVGIQEECG